MKKLFQKILTFILALITGFSAPVSINEEAVVSSQQISSDIFTYTVSDSGVIITEIAPQSPPADIIVPEYIDGLTVIGIDALTLVICYNPDDRSETVSARSDIKSLTVPYKCDILNIREHMDHYYWPLPLIKCKKQSAAHKTLFAHKRNFEIINDDGTEDYIWLDWVIKDGEAHITGMRKTSSQTDYYGYEAPSEVLVLPTVLEGCPVVSVSGFYGDYSCNTWTTGYDFTSIIISDSIETIKPEAFFLFNNIEKIYIGKNVKTIEELAFKECQIDDIVAGKNIQEIEPFAFMVDGWTTFHFYKNSSFHKFIEESMKNEFYFTEYWKIEFIDESHLTSNVAKIDEDGNVKGLPSGLTKDTAMDFLSVDGDAIMEISDDVIGTGTVIELINSEYGTVDNTYTVIMDGDINGDGNVNTTDDITAVRNIISGNDSAISDTHKKAADLNGDGIVNSTDLVLMKSMQN